MKNFILLLVTLVVSVIIPLAVILGIWAGWLPDSLKIYIAQFAVYASIAYIVVGTVYLMYSDIKTGRYSKQ